MATVNITYACGHTKGLWYAGPEYAKGDIEKAKNSNCFDCKNKKEVARITGLTFPASRVNAFRYDPHSSVRWGQQFHQFMGLEKCLQDKDFCDKLYNANPEEAKAMIRERIDTNN